MTGPGRPTLYKPENAARARLLCVLGATNRGLADDFGVARSTIDHWIATIPDFAFAVRQGREGGSRKAKKIVQHRSEATTATFKLDVPPDLRACIFWRNRRTELDDDDDEARWAEIEEAEERVRRMSAQ